MDKSFVSWGCFVALYRYMLIGIYSANIKYLLCACTILGAWDASMNKQMKRILALKELKFY